MIKYSILTFLLMLLTAAGFSQNDTAMPKVYAEVFDRITKGVYEYKLDTSAAPDDKKTREIIKLRNLRGGFNINEVVGVKIEEDRQKKEIPKETLDKFSIFFISGVGKIWLDNAVIWIYRN